MQIDGKEINKEIGEGLRLKISEGNFQPSLGILVAGNDRASLSFVGVKKRFGEKYGFQVNIKKISEDENKDYIISELLRLQEVSDGVIVQLPLPEGLKRFTEEILSHIDNSKDVDNLRGGDFEAPIVLALQKTMDKTNMDYSNKLFAIVGMGQVVGQPIKNYLDREGFKILVIGKGALDQISNADVVISGVGSPNLIKQSFVKQNVVLIDYGCSFVDDVPFGDFDKECYLKSSFYTPVPGCMGPLVVASLFENVFKAGIPRH